MYERLTQRKDMTFDSHICLRSSLQPFSDLSVTVDFIQNRIELWEISPVDDNIVNQVYKVNVYKESQVSHSHLKTTTKYRNELNTVQLIEVCEPELY